MTSEDRQALVTKLVGIAKDHGLDGSIDVYREDVTVLMAGAKETNMRISYEKKLGPEMKEKVDACKAAMKEAVGETKGVAIDLGV